jgi:hypothetical protein
MTRYLISFDEGAMTFPEVVQEAMDAAFGCSEAGCTRTRR